MQHSSRLSRNDIVLAFLLPVLLAMLLWPAAFFEGKSIYATDLILAKEPWKTDLSLENKGYPYNPELGDLDDYFFPQLAFHVREMHENGVLPLWNPGIYSGVPVAGNPQMPLLNPFNLGLLLFQESGKPFSPFRLSLGLSWMGILRFGLCFAFAFLWLRRLRAPPWLAATAALAGRDSIAYDLIHERKIRPAVDYGSHQSFKLIDRIPQH